jgi:hypothetical protein
VEGTSKFGESVAKNLLPELAKAGGGEALSTPEVETWEIELSRSILVGALVAFC